MREDRTKGLHAWCLTLLLAASVFPATFPAADANVDGARKTVEVPPSLPQAFIRNEGQLVNAEVEFYTVLGDLEVGFARRSILYHIRESQPERDGPSDRSRGVLVRVTFEDASPVLPAGRNLLPGGSNFLIGNDSSRWRSVVARYESLLYKGLYDGIDMSFRFADRALKYEFIVHPGADPLTIRARYEGAREIRVGPGGSLIMETAMGTLEDAAPVSYQGDRSVACQFVLRAASLAGLACVGWDPRETLVVDPLVYGSYLGGSGRDYAGAVTVGANGHVYVTGTTASADFPATPGAYDETYSGGGLDVFVARLRPLGQGAADLVYSTFLGGIYSQYSDEEWAGAIAVDSDGNAHVCGDATSGFPTTSGAYDTTYNYGGGDAFLAILSADGSSLLYSTFLGGYGLDSCQALAVDPSGNVFLSGLTNATDFPVTSGAFDSTHNGGFDAFFAQIAPSGSGSADLAYSTYLGGTSFDKALALVQSAGSVYLSGYTSSTDFPTTAGAFDRSANGGGDAFFSKITPAGSGAGDLAYSTYLGGAESDYATSVGLDAQLAAYVVGLTSSANFPVTSEAFDTTFGGLDDAFVSKLNLAGGGATDLAFSTFLGGGGRDSANSVAVFPSGETFVVGSAGEGFPVTIGAHDVDGGVVSNAFLSNLDPTGKQLTYSTFIGGSSNSPSWAYSVAIAGPEAAIVVGDTVEFPATPYAFDTTPNGDFDVFVAKFAIDPTYPVTLNTSPAGLEVRLGGLTFLGNQVVWCVADTTQILEAPTPQGTESPRWGFVSWSDGGPRSHQITCDGPAEYTAYFEQVYRVYFFTSPLGLRLMVDGVSFIANWTELWLAAGSHQIEAPSPQTDGDTGHFFYAWYDGGARTRTITVPGNTVYLAYFVVGYRITVWSSPSGRLVLNDGASFATPYYFWSTPLEGMVHVLDTPSPQVTGDTRYVFSSWSDGGAQNHSIVVTAPATYTATFVTEFRITLATAPSGLQVIADGITGTAPQSYWWASGSVHGLDTPSPQVLGGTRFSFTSWSDAGARAHSVVASAPETYTAAFVITDYRVTIDTSPPRLEVVVDGFERLSPASFWWAAGSLHEISTYSPQDVGATRYVFSSWSDAGAQTHTVKVNGPKTIRADFDVEYMVVVTTSPAGRSVIVDGVSVPTPQTYWWPQGSTHSLDVSSPQEVGDTRYVFASWSDGGATNHSVVVTAPATYTANFVTEFRITVATAPPGLQVIADGVTATAPQSYWWSSGSNHTLDVPSPQGTGSTRMAFRAWSDSGPRSRTVAVSGPASFTAIFELVHLVMVTSSPGNMQILIDGVGVTTPQTYWWADGSNHSLEVPSPQGIGDTRFVFSSWSDGGARSRTIMVVGPANYSASFAIEHRITLTTSPPALRVSVDGVPQDSPYAIWCLEGSTRTLDVPSPQEAASVRYRFASWSDGGAQAHVIVCDAPQSHVATFAASDYWIVVTTLPPGLEVAVDGVTSPAPAGFWCARSSVHTLDVPSPQGSGSVRQVFSSWSDGGPRSHPITCDAPMIQVATFVAGYAVMVTTSPGGLAVVVDGVSVSAPQTYWWPQGSIHNLNVPTPQGTGATRHAFVSWSDGGARSHNIVVTGAATFVAAFQAESLVTISTVPSGLEVIVDGVRVTSPQTYWWATGSLHELEAPSLQGAGATRPAFASWSDGGARVHRVTIGAPQAFIASYVLAHEVLLATQPPGLTVLVDGIPGPEPYFFWCVADSTFTVGAPSPQPLAGVTYAFDSWSDGGAQFRSVTCNAPATYVARFVEAPLGDFGLRAEPTEVSASAGGVVEVLVTVFGLDGYQGGSVDVALADAPAGVSGTCAPSAVTPPQSCMMTLIIASTVPSGSYLLVFEGTSGGRTRQASVTLVVLDANQGDFRLEVTPPALWLGAGQTVEVTVTVTALNGFAGGVRLRVLGVPDGVTAWISPTALMGSGTAVLHISLNRSVGAAVFLLAVEGESDGPAHLASLEIRVRSEAHGLSVVDWLWPLLLGTTVCLSLVAIPLRRLRRREGKRGGRVARFRHAAPESVEEDEVTGGSDKG